MHHLTLDDFHTAFLECNTTFKILNLKMLLPPYEQKKAIELTDGDEWLHMLREFLRKTDDLYEDTQETQEVLHTDYIVCIYIYIYIHTHTHTYVHAHSHNNQNSLVNIQPV
jgi:hypothetical protein